MSKLKADLALTLATHACDDDLALLPRLGIVHGISNKSLQLIENILSTREQVCWSIASRSSARERLLEEGLDRLANIVKDVDWEILE